MKGLLSNVFAIIQFLLTGFWTNVFASSETAFRDPPREYRPKFRYWLPDASVPSQIVAKDIRDAAEAGAGGLEFLPFYLYGLGNREAENIKPPTDWNKYGFGTPAFSEIFKKSLKAAEDNDILMDFAVGANQAQGIPSKVMTPGLAVELLMGNTTVAAGRTFSGPVPPPRQPSETMLSGMGFMGKLEQFGTPNLTAVIAYQVSNQTATRAKPSGMLVYLQEDSFVDLTNLVNNGQISWTPPTTGSSWRIFSFWEAYTNQRSSKGGIGAKDFIANGSWVVDHFSKAGAARVTDFWDQYILSDAEISRLLKSVGKYAWEDSMEILASCYWTPGFISQFEESNKYNLIPYLPLLFTPSNTWNGALPIYWEQYTFGNSDSDKVFTYNIDYRKVLNEGYQAYTIHFNEWAHSKGFGYSSQPAYNLPLEALSDIPLVDAPEGESLGFGRLVDAYRQFAGPAHLFNKTVISTELGAVNTAAYSLTIPDLLQQVKRSLAGGFTMHVLHGFTYSGPYPNTTWPGYTTFWYQFTEMWNYIQPAWQHMKDSLDFIGRNQYILQQGVPEVDLAFYIYAAPWSPRLQYNSPNLQNLGFTYDYLGPENLASTAATVKHHTLGIPAYKTLIFYHQGTITVEAANKLIDLTRSGLPIIYIDMLPHKAYPYTLKNQQALNATMSDLVSSKMVHMVRSIEAVPSILSSLNIRPHTALNCPMNTILPVRRFDSASKTTYLYFYNDASTFTNCTANVSISNPVLPYVYNAWTGNRTRLITYTQTTTTLSFPLSLEPNESLLLALLPSSGPAEKACSVSSTTGSLQSFTIDTSKNHLIAKITGPTTLTTPNRTITLNPSSLPPPTNLTKWNLTIEDWHSAPNRSSIQTEKTLRKYSNISLRAWKDLDRALEPVSGVGVYTTRFTVPAFVTNNSNPNFSTTPAAILHLPPIQHTARVYINSIQLPPIDPVKPVIDISDYVQRNAGNEIDVRIEVTTTLFNRIKSEADKVMIVGLKASELQSGYRNGRFVGYGLVGDVRVVWGVGVDLGEC